MAEEVSYRAEAAAEYDRAFAHVSTHFVPSLLRAVRLAPGMRVLDIATGTGLAAEPALGVVGPAGHVTAADVSPSMVERARARFGTSSNSTANGVSSSAGNPQCPSSIASVSAYEIPARTKSRRARGSPPSARCRASLRSRPRS